MSARPFEAVFVCDTCGCELLLYADAHDASRVKKHAEACAGALKCQRIAIDPKVPAESAYALGARGWPFFLEPR